MTEDDARTKWCPFARAVVVAKGAQDVPTHNRLTMVGMDHSAIDMINCIASECMAWRWSDVRRENYNKDIRVSMPTYSASTTEGYCGLAGET